MDLIGRPADFAAAIAAETEAFVKREAGIVGPGQNVFPEKRGMIRKPREKM
jgi:hypothetical protein